MQNTDPSPASPDTPVRPAGDGAGPTTTTAQQTSAAPEVADTLLTDPAFLLNAHPDEVTALFAHARSRPARAMARAYCTALHHGSAALPWLLDLHGRRATIPGPTPVPATGNTAAWRTTWTSAPRPGDRLVRETGPGALTVVTGVVDGRPVAVNGSYGDTVLVWDLSPYRQISKPLIGHTGQMHAAAVGVVDGRPVVVTGDGVWDLFTGEQVGKPMAGGARAVSLGVLEGRPIAVTGGWDHTVRVWDLTTRQQIGEPLTGHTSDVVAVATAVVDGRPVAVTGSWDDTVRVWDLTTRQQIGEPLTGHTDSVCAVATAVVDGRPVAVTGSWDHTVRVWDLTTHRQIGEPLTGHTGWVETVAAAVLDGRPVAVTGGGHPDATVRVWDLTTRQQIGKPYTGHSVSVEAVAAAVVDGRPVAVTAESGGTARMWDLDEVHTGLRNTPDALHSRTIRAAAVTAVGERTLMLTGGEEQKVTVWDPATGRTAGDDLGGPYPGPIRAITTLLVDGQPIAVTGSARTLQMRQLTTGELLREESANRDYLALATHTVKGKPVVLAAVHTWLRVIDPETGRARRLPHPATVTAVTTGHLDGRPVAITTTDQHTIHTWDLTTKKPLTPAYTRPTAVGALHLTTIDEEPALLTAFGRWLRLTDPRTGAHTTSLISGHTRPITAITTMTMGDTSIAVTGSHDTTLRTWNLTTSTPTPLGPPLPFPHPITTLTPTPDGDLIVTHGPETTRLTPGAPQ
ncbi:WD40 repeat domain-containing protein [Streptomyces sp. NPDC018693]|uniref:WD40 repeat domain-containing protein n=1 Tax=unclassified Streptomyces TaxID=2593676 RepID=UPI0037B50F23